MVEKNLELGVWEATWTLSGYDTLKARIEVKDTGVTCISVEAGGACNSSTPPGVRVSAFTVTGYLKSAVAEEGYLKVNTLPTGASVTVGAVSCGTTPVTTCALSPGWHEIILTKTGYKPRVLMEEIKVGLTLDLGTITLTPGVPPTGFDDWVTGKGGKDAIKGKDISELVDAFTGIGDVGFIVTGGNINKATDYYTGIG